MIPKLTDDAIARLPLTAGRAELLEEIMRADAPERPLSDPAATDPAPARTRHRWLVPLAAAAAVAAIAVASVVWRGTGDDPRGSSTGVTTAPPSASSEESPSSASSKDYRAVLDAPGWSVSSTTDMEGYGSTNYENGSRSLEVTWYPADSYQQYVADREYIVDPPAPGTPIEVMGRAAQMWAYSGQDHTAIREVENGHWMEVRGFGMDQAEYLELLGHLRLVSLSEYEQALPENYVDQSERPGTARAMLTGITDVTGTGWPPGGELALESKQQDPYHLGADVAGRYACAWLAEFQDATKAGNADRASEAARVLGTSRQWPVLLEMNREGDFPEVLWDYADEAVGGRVPEGYRMGLGCP